MLELSEIVTNWTSQTFGRQWPRTTGQFLIELEFWILIWPGNLFVDPIWVWVEGLKEQVGHIFQTIEGQEVYIPL